MRGGRLEGHGSLDDVGQVFLAVCAGVEVRCEIPEIGIIISYKPLRFQEALLTRLFAVGSHP